MLTVTIQPGAAGDTTSVYATLLAATENVVALPRDPAVAEKICEEACGEFVADKGYHSNETISALADIGTRSYISEPKRVAGSGAVKSEHATRCTRTDDAWNVSAAKRSCDDEASTWNVPSRTASRAAACDACICDGARTSRSATSCTSRRATWAS